MANPRKRAAKAPVKRARSAPARPADRERARLIFWPWGLFGNPGGDLSVEELFGAVAGSLDDAQADPGSRLHAIAARVEVEMIEVLEAEEIPRWREDLRERFAVSRDAGELPVLVGGNHLVLLPVLEAYAAAKARTLVVSFDAHLDAYDMPGTRERLHHGNFLLHFRRPRHVALAAVGDRDHFLSRETAAQVWDEVLDMRAIAARPLEESVEAIRALAAGVEQVHLDIDLDVLDPGALRAVGTPSPCGLSLRELTAMIEPLLGPKLSGVTVSEYSRAADADGTGRQLVAWLLEHILLRRYE